MSKHEYNDLLFDISKRINANELPRLVFMCRDDIAAGSEDRIQDVLTLFKELEKENHLGIDRLDTLKEILTRMKKRSLLKKVEEFEIKRKAQSVGIISSLKRAAGSLVGAVKLVCNFRTLAGGLVLVGSGLALRSCSTFEEYSDVFNKVVLPAFTKLVELGESSLCFTVQAETASALKELWKMYNNGTLKSRLQGFLITEEVKQLAAGEDVDVTVFIDEEQYKEAYLNLMLLQSQASDVAGEERSTEGRRKSSDSFLFLTPKEDKVSLMKLKQAENKLNFKIQILQKEIEKLKTEVAEEEPAQTCKNTGETGDTRTVFFKDLSVEVMNAMGNRIEADDHATRCILQSFGIPDHFSRNFGDLFHFFSDTPVKLLRDVCEALQLYDLVDLLEKPIPRVTKSLRPVLTLDEVRKLGKIGARPIAYHSRAAVLILAGSEDDSYVKSCESFFKSLDNKSEVNIIQCGDRLKLAREWQHMTESSLIRAKAELQRLYRSIKNVRRGEQWQQVEQQNEMIKLTSQFQMQRQTVEQLEKELEEIKAKEKKEEENIKTAASKVIDRWTQRQDEFSFFAAFNFSAGWSSYYVIRKLTSRIPYKTKFFVGWLWPKVLSETLQVSVPLEFSTLLLDILNKRWQILDLVSMMDELKRSAHENGGRNAFPALLLRIEDTLSSLPRFKREEDLS